LESPAVSSPSGTFSAARSRAPDGAGEGRLDLVATAEGDLQEVGQLVGVEVPGGGAAEAADDLLGA
jgi:hypothetical protein